LAYLTTGNEEQAREYLNKANQWTDKVLSDKEHPSAWNRRATLKMLRNEAEMLLNSGDPEPTEDDQELETKTNGQVVSGHATPDERTTQRVNDWLDRHSDSPPLYPPVAHAEGTVTANVTGHSAEAEWQRVVELAGDDPMPWIRRGRWYAEHGRQEQADLDFSQAIAATSSGRPAMAATPFTPEEAVNHQQAWADYLHLPVQFENSIGMKFQLVPPGVFQMGTPPEDREKITSEVASNSPDAIKSKWVREVEEEGFARVFLSKPVYTGQFEVTVEQFRRFVSDTGYQTDGERLGVGGYASRDGWKRDPSHVWSSPCRGWELLDQQPVVHMSWNDAVAFCDWLSKGEGRNYSLPTEAQWEFACRSGSGSLYAIGDDPSVLEAIAWNRDTLRTAGLQHTQVVGAKAANAFGLHDMLGNASEWCLDVDAPGTREAVLIDPAYCGDNNFHIFRGGSWIRRHTHSRCSGRYGLHVDIFDALTGFRVWLKIDSDDARLDHGGSDNTVGTAGSSKR
jgi:sulfatase modifying factor 1